MSEYTHTHIAGVFEQRANMENPSDPIDDSDDELGVSTGPFVVTEATAQTFPPWWQALNVLSGDVAQLPIFTYGRQADGGKKKATDHPTYRILHRQPNPDMGPFQFKQLNTLRMLARGNSYNYIQRKGGQVKAIWPLDPGTVTPVRENGELRYVHRSNEGKQTTLHPFEVLHLRGPGESGMEGASVFRLARESLAGGMQAQRYGTRFFANDAKPGVVLEFPEAMDTEAAKNILRHWSKRHGGASNAGRPALLDKGGKVSAFSMSNEDAQFLESREFSRGEIASWFNLPPHKVGDLTHATFSNIEQQSIDYVVYSLMPWLIRWQDECNAKLFSIAEVENDTHFCEFQVSALLRGDYNSRMEGHIKALSWGIMSIDEVRSLENMNKLPDGLGESHYFPLNMAAIGEPLPTEDKPASEEGEDQARQVLSVALLNELSRAYRRIGKSATRAANTEGRLQVWLDTTLDEEIRNVAAKVSPLLGSGATERTAEELAGMMQEDFRGMVAEEVGPGDQKIRIEHHTKRLSRDRPSELVAKLWE